MGLSTQINKTIYTNYPSPISTKQFKSMVISVLNAISTKPAATNQSLISKMQCIQISFDFYTKISNHCQFLSSLTSYFILNRTEFALKGSLWFEALLLQIQLYRSKQVSSISKTIQQRYKQLSMHIYSNTSSRNQHVTIKKHMLKLPER